MRISFYYLKLLLQQPDLLLKTLYFGTLAVFPVGIRGCAGAWNGNG